MTTVRPVRLTPKSVLPAGTSLTSSADVVHELVPWVIFVSLLSVWPPGSWQQRRWRIALALSLRGLILLLSTSFHLVGLMDMSFQELAQQQGFAVPVPFVLNWMIFMESGGMRLLPVVAAAILGSLT